MEIYNQHHEEGRCEHAPIRGSIFFLVTKLLVILLLFELIYGAVYYILTLGIPLPFDLHHHVAVVIFVLEIVKIMTQVFLILNVSLSWANNVYFINGKHLIKRTGIMNTEEDIYEFDTVRSVAVNQSWLGRIFHYGDISLKTSASGGYQVIVTIAGITDPHKYEKMIKECL
jgi:uncharacterized membrane protein YdbT with pleckstrin-like domain